MARKYSILSLEILKYLQNNVGTTLHELYDAHTAVADHKTIYDTLFRLIKSDLARNAGNRYEITDQGIEVIHIKPQLRDGVWKIVIFDIPEKNRSIRNILRQRLTLLGFKKWQNSIWVSPFAIEPAIEQEMKELAKRYFIRLIKSTDINFTHDLNKLFPQIDKSLAN